MKKQKTIVVIKPVQPIRTLDAAQVVAMTGGTRGGGTVKIGS